MFDDQKAVLPDTPLTLQRDGYTLTTDRNQIPIDGVAALLATTYWANHMTREQIARAMQLSVCIGVLSGDRLIGFARVITDLVTYGYLCDVVVERAHNGKGIAQWMVRTMLEHPDMQGFRRFALLTRDAQTLYSRFGFSEKLESSYMELKYPKLKARS